MSSNANQSKDNRYFICDMVFQSKTSFNLLNCIEKNLAPLYKPNKQNEKRNIPIKDKNMEFRNNEVNYLTILMRLDYFFYMLEEHTSKLINFGSCLLLVFLVNFSPI